MIAAALRRYQTKTRWCIYPHYVGRIYVGFVKLVHKYSRYAQLLASQRLQTDCKKGTDNICNNNL